MKLMKIRVGGNLTRKCKMDKNLTEILAKLAEWDGSVQEPYKDWMGELDYPVHPEELLDLGMADLLPLMNIKDKMWTQGSCMHQPGIDFMVLDDEWFKTIALPIILKINDDDFVMTLTGNYWGVCNNDLTGRGVTYHWDIKPASYGADCWYARHKVLDWYKGVYLAFKEIREASIA